MAFSVAVNLWVVLLATVVYFILGAIWYTFLFGKIWMKAMKVTKKDVENAKKKGMAKSYIYNFISNFIMVYVLAVFVGLAGASTLMEGIYVGFLVWLGFFVTTAIGGILWENKTVELFLINVGYNLVGLAISGILLAVL